MQPLPLSRTVARRRREQRFSHHRFWAPSGSPSSKQVQSGSARPLRGDRVPIGSRWFSEQRRSSSRRRRAPRPPLRRRLEKLGMQRVSSPEGHFDGRIPSRSEHTVSFGGGPRTSCGDESSGLQRSRRTTGRRGRLFDARFSLRSASPRSVPVPLTVLFQPPTRFRGNPSRRASARPIARRRIFSR